MAGNKREFKRMRSAGERIFMAREYGMFSKEGNNFVHNCVAKFKLKSKKFHANWRARAQQQFEKTLRFIKSKRKFPELTDTAVRDNILLALI